MHSFWLESVTIPVLHKMLECLRESGNAVYQSQPMIPVYSVNGSGIFAEVDYDPISLRAKVTIYTKPMLVSYSYIEGEVRKHLAVASGAV